MMMTMIEIEKQMKLLILQLRSNSEGTIDQWWREDAILTGGFSATFTSDLSSIQNQVWMSLVWAAMCRYSQIEAFNISNISKTRD